MIKYKCDRCGKDLSEEIKSGTSVTLYSTKSSYEGGCRTFDLCARCYSLVEQLINRKIERYSDFCT